jgi:methyltransferase
VSDPQTIVLIVATLRAAELVYAARNSRRLLAEGGREVGGDHYPLFVLLHGGWLAALFFLVPADAPVHPVPLALFGVLLAARAWVILSLGYYWTTRVITVPDAPLVRGGPYRFVRHPNYLVVAGEIAVLPLAFGAWPIALAFSLLNAALLRHRIRVEDGALAARRAIRS